MRRASMVAIGAGAVVATAAAAVLAVGIGRGEGEPEAGDATPTRSLPSTAVPESEPAVDAPTHAAAFLDTWVDDGRVVRRDQGDDTVSEGQAYGLLAAVVADDEESFDAVWDWTTANLVRDDGLLAWRWAEGDVVDDEPASDADLDAARALVLAGDAWDRPDLSTDGVELAEDIMDRMTVQTDHGRILLPGLWAVDQTPYAYNPSYASPAAFTILAEATGDPRWGEVQAGSQSVTTGILSATALPPDWAQVHVDGRIEPMPGPLGGGDPVQYSYDASRLALRYAESCDPNDVALAARTFETLDRSDDLAAALDLGGGPLTEDSSPLGYGARAAAAGASGDTDAARDDLDRSAALANEFPTYYGTAWAMLSSAMLTSDTLRGCPVLEEVTP